MDLAGVATDKNVTRERGWISFGSEEEIDMELIRPTREKVFVKTLISSRFMCNYPKRDVISVPLQTLAIEMQMMVSWNADHIEMQILK